MSDVILINWKADGGGIHCSPFGSSLLVPKIILYGFRSQVRLAKMFAK